MVVVVLTILHPVVFDHRDLKLLPWSFVMSSKSCISNFARVTLVSRSCAFRRLVSSSSA